jgi:putative addiction module component (TIGR02574 family)
MTDTVQLSEEAAKLLPALNALSAKDRIGLARRLLGDTEASDGDEAEVRAAWKAEVSRRLEEITSGKVVGIPAEEVDRMMREKYP